jgi:hypothetical protein
VPNWIPIIGGKIFQRMWFGVVIIRYLPNVCKLSSELSADMIYIVRPCILSEREECIM